MLEEGPTAEGDLQTAEMLQGVEGVEGLAEGAGDDEIAASWHRSLSTLALIPY